jgi:hypothetical protein
VEWSTTLQRRRSSFSSTIAYHWGVTAYAHRSARRDARAGHQDMPEACPYNNCVGTRLRRVRSLPDKSPAQHALRGTHVPSTSPTLGRHGPCRDANREQCLSTGCSCCYFLWKKVTKELCGIGTHASIAAPRAIGFGACGVREAERPIALCTET